MRQLKAELDEEIKDRRMIELKQNVINGGVATLGSASSSTSSNGSQPAHQSRGSNGVRMREKTASIQPTDSDGSDAANRRKIRSKSVTFLDDMNTDDELIDMMEVEKNQTPKQQ